MGSVWDVAVPRVGAMVEDADDGVVRLVEHPRGTAVQLDRPRRRNALTLSMWRQLASVVAEEGGDTSAPLYVVGASGYFCSGADLATLAWARSAPERATDFVDAVVAALLTLHTVPRQVVALVEGGAAGGGVEIMAACDARVGVGAPQLVFPFGQHGMVLDGFTRWRLGRLVGEDAAERLVDGRHVVAAEEALALGLLDALTTAVTGGRSPVPPPGPPADTYLRPGEDLEAAVRRAASPMLAALSPPK